MTWSKAESQIIEDLTKQSAATAENVKEIKEAIVGSLLSGGKPGLQDKVRDLGAGVDRVSGELIVHRAKNKKAHQTLRRAVVVVGVAALIALVLNFDVAVVLIELVIKWLT